jgi:hypothetical protein
MLKMILMDIDGYFCCSKSILALIVFLAAQQRKRKYNRLYAGFERKVLRLAYVVVSSNTDEMSTAMSVTGNPTC